MTDVASTARAWSGKPRPGSVRLVEIAGVPVYLNRSFLVVGAAVLAASLVWRSSLRIDFVFYVLIVAVHEAGHALAAKLLKLRVFGLEISGGGGMCHVQVPRGSREAFLLYAAGVLAQLVLLAAALAWVSTGFRLFTETGQAVWRVLVFANGLVAVFNLVPTRDANGVANDGTVLWAVIAHRFRGGPHPRTVIQRPTPVFHRDTRLLSKPGFCPPDFVTGLELLNDNTTPMEFVVGVLERHLGLDRAAAIPLMLEIHHKGGVLLPVAEPRSAQAIAQAISEEARAGNHLDFVCRAVDARRGEGQGAASG
jgi:ATP-dependent Clp protease adapter protein ClpS